MLRFIFVLLIALLFVLLAAPFLDRPGLHYDEALEAGLPATQLLAGLPVMSANGVVLRAWGKEFPLMVQNHIGAIQVYTAIPFVSSFGPTVESLRIMALSTGVITLIATFAFMYQVYGLKAACYGSIWLAIFPSFVFWFRQGVFISSISPCLIMCALAIAVYGMRSRRLWLISGAGLLLGLAAYSKLNALWVVISLVSWILLQKTVFYVNFSNDVADYDVANYNGKPSWKAILMVILGFSVGFYPFILYNFISKGATIIQIRANASSTYLGVNNANILANLQTRIFQLADVIRSGDHLWYLGGTFPSHIALWSFIASLVIALADCIVSRDKRWIKLIFAPLVILVAVLLSCFTISSLWPTHFAVISMFPAVVFGTGVQCLFDWGEKCNIQLKLTSRLIIAPLIFIVFTSQICSDLRYLEAAKRTGGLSFHSSAIYDVYHFLEKRPEHLVALDWGIAAQIEYLSGGRMHVEELYDYSQGTSREFANELRSRLNKDNLYITHAMYQEAFQRRETFLQAVAAAGLHAQTVNVSIRGDGWPMIEVWQLQ
jgi:hypothetical protein